MADHVFNLGIASETKAAALGIKSGLIDPLDDAQKELFDLGKDKSLDELAKDLQQAADKSEAARREISKLADQTEAAARGSMRKLGESAQDSATTAKESMAEIKQEALANASETFSSFDGDIESFADGIQGTFGGLIASIGPLLGPAGLLAAVAGAAGVGLITNALRTAGEEQAKLRDDAAELAEGYLEAGSKSSIGISKISDKLREMVSGGDEAYDGLVELRDLIRRTGQDGADWLGEIAVALAGDSTNLDALIESQKAYREQLLEAKQDAFQASGSFAAGYDSMITSTSTLIGLLERQGQVGAMALDQISAAEEASTQKALAHAAAVESIDAAYDEAAGAAADFIDAESGVFDVDAYVTAMKAREDALDSYQQRLAAANLSPEVEQFLASQGADVASAMLQGYLQGTTGQKDELERIWTEAAGDSSGAYTTTVQRKLAESKVTIPPPIFQMPDPGPLIRNTQAYLDRNTLKIRVEPVDRFGKPVL